MSQYDIEPQDNPPDFNYTKGNEEEQKHVASVLVLLESFYNKYKNKSPDYILTNIEEDSKKLERDIISKHKNLDSFFNSSRDEELIAAGILVGNIKKTGITSIEIDDLKLEQKYTTQSIVQGTTNSIKAKAACSKYRNTEDIFSIDSNIRTATNRSKNMASTGVRDTRDLAQLAAFVFLFGDPLENWITAGDDKVCKYCLEVERNSPMPASKMPRGPLHPHCGERCHKELHEEDGLVLTAAALALTFYDI